MAFPQVIRLGISAFPARLAYGMIGLGIFFKAEQETGSIAIAGFAIGLNSLAGSLTAGLRGSVMDKFGQKWPIRILVPIKSGRFVFWFPCTQLLFCYSTQWKLEHPF